MVRRVSEVGGSVGGPTLRRAERNYLGQSRGHAALGVGDCWPESMADSLEVDALEGVPVGVIDGPYCASTLSGILAQAPINLGRGRYGSTLNSSACDHGTFIMGALGARKDAIIPGLCPDCRLLHVPLFADLEAPWAGTNELAAAIRVAIDAGAKLLNLSLAIVGNESQYDPELALALDYARASGAVIVAAAGNQGRLATGQLLSHPVTIPVVAVDAANRLIPESNFGPSMARRGVAAVGQYVLGYATDGGIAAMSGTSIATAIVSGTLAELWSKYPDADGAEIRAAVGILAPRNGSIPPMLDRHALLSILDGTDRSTAANISRPKRGISNFASLQGEAIMKIESGLSGTVNREDEPTPRPIMAVTPASGAAGCTCGAPQGVCACTTGHGGHSGFVYAIGTVEAEYPNIAIEREMQIMAEEFGVQARHAQDMSTRPTEDRFWQHEVLSRDRKRTRYLARQMSWRLTIEDFPAFVLKPRDPNDLDALIDCLERPKYPTSDGSVGERGENRKRNTKAPLPNDPPRGALRDLDVIVGVSGSHTEDGIEVLLDQIFTISPAQLAPHGLQYFAQLADNYGLSDGDRAYNFLMARYALPPIERDFELTSVPAISSRLTAGGHRVVRVIYTFKNTNVPIERKYFVRVDVTHEFPIIINPWQRYLERGEQL